MSRLIRLFRNGSPNSTLRPYAIQSLESRRLLSLSPVQAASAIPFQELTIDANPGTVPVVNVFADILGNGKLDVVTGHENNLGGGGIFWYEYPASGNPNDVWIKHTIDAHASTYEAAYPFDVNGDGAVDLIFSDYNQTVWYENPLGHGGNPRTDPWVQHVIGNYSAHEMYVTDLNGDGKPDIVTNYALYFQNSPDSWTTVAAPNFDHTVKGLALFDSGSGLGAIDLVGTGNARDNITWWENPRDHGGNALTDPWIPHIISLAYVPLGNQINDPGLGVSFVGEDVNGDGRMDIVSCGGEAAQPYPAGGLMWWEAPVDRINGTWIPHTIDANVELVHNLRLADMNGDGQQDLVVFEQDQSPQERLMIVYNEGGTGQNWLEQTLATTGGHNEWIGDANGDGALDIVNSRHGFYNQVNPIQVWMNGLADSGVVAPSITVAPQSQTVASGPVTFSVTADGTGPLDYQWERDGVDIPGATEATYNIANVDSDDDDAIFRCVVSNARGFLISPSATLSVGSGEVVASNLTASLTGTPPAIVAAGVPYQFAVTYLDPVPISASSLGLGSLNVTGPDGYSQVATLISGGLLDSTRIEAAYSVPPPTVGGVYTVSVVNTSVSDASGGALPVGTVGTFTITTVPPLTSGPDLEAAIIGKQPASVIGGVKGMLTVRITNKGEQAAIGTIASDIFLTDTSNTTSEPASSDSIGLALKPHASKTVRLAFTYPSDLSTGAYRVGVTVNSSSAIPETDFTNNTASSDLVTVAPPVISLGGSFGTIPTNLHSGRKAPIVVTLSNGGNIAYGGTVSINVFATNDPDGDNAVLVGTLTRKQLRIKPGARLKFAMKFDSSPAGVTADAFLLAVVGAGDYGLTIAPQPITLA